MSSKNKVSAQNELFRAGVAQYYDALLATRAFQDVTQDYAIKVLNKKRDTLQKAMKIVIHDEDFDDYVFPEKSKEPIDWCWIAIEMTLKDEDLTSYFGLLFRREHGNSPATYVVAVMNPGRRSLSEALQGICVSRGIDAEQNDKEIILKEPISGGDPIQFENSLGNLIDQWITVWNSCGGLKGLGKKT